MQFDPKNKVIKLCADGMEQEGMGNPDSARVLFKQAWELASTDFEKFTAAHYVARHQPTVEDKLTWDKLALAHALNLRETDLTNVLPSLYLNIAKCYEDLGIHQLALENYQAGLDSSKSNQDSHYDIMIKTGLDAGLGRLQRTNNETQTTNR